MGADESSARGIYTDPYFIIDDGAKQTQNIVSSTVDVIHAQRIAKTGFSGIWSMFAPKAKTPIPRQSHWAVEIPQTNTAVCGYGLDGRGNCLRDVWELNLKTYAWTQLPIDLSTVTPRNGSTAVRIARKICVFGGYDGSQYLSDFHVIDLETRTVFRPKFTNDGPPERIGHVMATYNNAIVIWGGYNGDWLNDLWLLNLNNLTWQKMPVEVKGRIGSSWVNHRDNLYIFGASKSDPLLRFNWTTHTLVTAKTTGTPPPSELSFSSMVSFDRYLLVIGGKYNKETHGLIHGFDTVTQRWFVFHVIPDGITTTVLDGTVDKFGYFMVPMSHSVSMIYQATTRKVVMFMGAPLIDPPNVGVIDIGEAMSVMHLQTDMLEIL